MNAAESMLADMLGRILLLDAQIATLGEDCHRLMARLNQAERELETARMIVAQTLEDQQCPTPR